MKKNNAEQERIKKRVEYEEMKRKIIKDPTGYKSKEFNKLSYDDRDEWVEKQMPNFGL